MKNSYETVSKCKVINNEIQNLALIDNTPGKAMETILLFTWWSIVIVKQSSHFVNCNWKNQCRFSWLKLVYILFISNCAIKRVKW